MFSEHSVIDCLAASYRLDLPGDAYIRHLVEAAAPMLDHGLGVIAYTYDASDPGRPRIDHFATSKRFDTSWLKPFYDAVEAAGHRGPPHPTGYETWSHLLCGQATAVPKMRPLLPVFSHLGGSRDTFAVNALDANGRGVWLGAPMRSVKRAPTSRVTLMTRFSTHLAAAMRLRRNAESPKTKGKAAAILSPTGALLDATKDEVVDAREELRRATLDFDGARTKKARSAVELATRRWRPLVSSRWSLLDEFDTDGRRFVVAVENAPPTRPPRKDLSEREHQVMTQAHLGHTDKVIAYELGLSVSTVRVLFHRAAKKLGTATRREALARFDELAKRAEHPAKDESPV